MTSGIGTIRTVTSNLHGQGTSGALSKNIYKDTDDAEKGGES